MSDSVSVVIPCFNSAAWLRQAIESSLANNEVQEVFVVDDGSTDGSADIAAKFGPPVHVIRQNHAGGNRARNAGLHAATGDWIQFLDADDYLTAKKIGTQLNEAGPDATNTDVLYSPVYVETWKDAQNLGGNADPIDQAADLYTQWITWQLPQTGGPLWRRTSLLKLGGWKVDQPCCQEHELYLRSLQSGQRWKFCPTPGAVYRIWSQDTVCRRDPVRVIRERTRLLQNMKDWLTSQSLINHRHKLALEQACFEMARTWAQEDLVEATRYFSDCKKTLGIRASGPAARWHYKLAFHLLGFSRAERIAKRLRR